MYQVHSRIMDPITRKQLMIHMHKDMLHSRHLLMATICSPKHLMGQILLVYLDGPLHNRTINLRIPLRARA